MKITISSYAYAFLLFLLFLFSVHLDYVQQSVHQTVPSEIATMGFDPTEWILDKIHATDYSVPSEEVRTQLQIAEKITSLHTFETAYRIANCEDESFYREKIKTIKKELSSKIQEKTAGQSSLFMMPTGTCPQIQAFELLGIPGFSETNELVICGAPDTLAFLIFIEEPGNISGTQMTAKFLPGMQYAGFETTHYNTTTIANLDPSPDQPKFLLEGITDGVYVAYIGVEATCDADIDAFNYEVDLDFSFIYEDTLGNFQSCRQSITPDRSYNSIIKEPVLNFRSVPITDITALGQEFCTDITLSQDGIQAYLEEVEFSVCNVDFATEIELTSVSANGMTIPFTYNAADSILNVNVPSSFFQANSAPNPADDRFDESEQLTMQLCMIAKECPLVNTQFITYKAAYHCNEDICQVTSSNSEIRVRPTTVPTPIASSVLVQQPGVCGNPAILELTLQSSVADSASGTFTDLTFGFKTCEKSALDISKVTLGGTEIAAGNYQWIGTDLNIDLTNITSDPDGAGGITDIDGDGFFDDLPGGSILNIQVELDFICAIPDDPTTLACSSLDCSFGQFYVNARRDCGQLFTHEPPVEDFSIINGATSVGFNNQDQISTTLIGYNFGNTRTTGANCTPLPASIKTVEFCYVYERENIEPCAAANTTNELQVLFDGTPRLVHDVEFVAGSGEMTVNGVTTQTGVTGTFTDLSPSTRLLNLPIGELNVGDEVCYIYQLAADSASCSPPIYMNGTHQVIETCMTDGCTCQTVKACDVTLFRSDPSNCECICDISSGANTKRWNLGYTDKSMTTKVQEADVPLEDLNRYLPCDTMYYEGWMTFNTPESVDELYQWFFIANITNIGNNGWVGNDDTELMIDASGTELLGLDFSANGSGGVRAPIDISSFSDCLDNPNTTGATGFLAFAGKTPWSDVTLNTPSCNSGFEYSDGNLFGVYFRNFDKLEDCRETETAAWEESNCLDQIKDAFNIQVGDTIYMKWLLPLTKNVKTAANLIADPAHIIRDPQIINVAGGSFLDPFDSDCLVTLTNCRENTPFQTFCPEDLNVVTAITTDDCGGEVSHKFNVVTPTPVNWYTQEFRPFFTIEDIDIPFYSPFMYCGGAKLISKSGIEYPLSIQGMQDHTCATVDGQEYCTVSSGSTGTLTFNPEADGFPGLGVGLSGCIDEFEIVYDLCKICPSDPIDFSNYELTYDYRTCETLNGNCFRCNNTATDTSNELPKICGINGSALVDRLGSYYTLLNLDTLFRKDNVISGNVTTSDTSTGFPALSQSQDRNLLASGSPGISEEINTIEVCADGADPSLETHNGVLASITLTNSIAFVGVYDMNMNPLVFNPVSSNATSTTYSVFLPDLAPGECTTFKIGTTLLFCPTAPDRPQVCVTTTSGCMDPAIMAALAGSATACNSIETCYEYVFEEAGLQADFIRPLLGEIYALCDTIEMAVLVKNVKTTTLTDITMDIDLPIVGATIVPGSFEASYPNSGNLSLPFYAISDPLITGNNLLYSEDADFSQAIHTNGLPGVTSAADSNFVVVRFLLITTCDEFVSGSQAIFEATAADPCSPNTLNSGVVNSPRIIIDGANPADFGQVLVTAKPSEVYCGQETPTFVITGQNISEQSLGDSVLMCVTLPPSLNYRPGSMRYIIPNTLPVGTETITTINGQTQVCFQGYENMPVGGAFTLNFEADFDTDAACGDYEIGTDIKNLVEDQVCVSGEACDVFVQSSVNPIFNLTLKGPLETVDLQLYRRCTDTDDPVTICYEVTLTNPGPDYTGDVSVNLHDDILANQTLEFYDPILGNDVYASTFVASGETITLTGCFTMDAINSCPVILDMVYESPCECDHDATPFTTLEPEFMAELPATTVLCPGGELGLATCGDYDLTYNPASNMIERVVGDSVYLSVIDPSILTQIFYTGTAGECSVSGVRSIRGLEAFDFELTAMTCEGQDAILQLDVPSEYQGIISTQWAPASNLDDPTRIDPVFNAAIPGTYAYEVTLTFGDGCILKDSVFVEVKPIGTISIAGNSTICYPFETNTLTADAGFDFYEWYLVEGGFDIVKASTPTEIWTGVTEPGKYIVKAFRSTDMCPSISDPIMIMQAECIDLELEKTICEIADTPKLGDTIAYQITVCNRRVVDSLLTHDANMVTVNEALPAGVLYVGNTTTQGIYTPGSGQWDIGTIPSGACHTLKLQVQIIAAGKQKNTAEITNSDKEDIDSEEDNDDGDQSEDDEDMAMFTIPVCTASNTGPYCSYEAIVLNETGGDATSWSWTGPAGFSSTIQMPTVAPSVAGTYTVLITDADGNKTTCATVVTVHPEVTISGVTTDPTCNGFTNGKIDVEVIGGTSPFTYDWSDDGPETPDNDTQNLLNIGVGAYSITVTDAVGCTVTQDFTIGEPTVLSCTTTPTDILCNGDNTGVITAMGTGGTAPYEYSIDGITWQSDITFNNLIAGSYTISVRDAQDCISTCNALVAEPIQLMCTIGEVLPESCIDSVGSIQISSIGGTGSIRYSIDNGVTFQSSGLFTGLDFGFYEILVIDDNGCTTTCSTPVPSTCFDLALNKTTQDTGPFNYGDIITFDFTVFNQGGVTATNIEVIEYMPCGYEFIPALNPQWVQGSANTATTLITDTLAEGEFTSVPISFVIQPCAEPGAWKNTGEIVSSEDDEGNDTTDSDRDSDADDDPNNDGDMSDNDVNNENGDEDDSDFEVIEIFDLAQIKQAITPGPYTYGSIIDYAITVYNQGNIPAANITITDYIPTGLVFDPAVNSAWVGTAPLVSTIIPGTLLPGDSTIVYLQLMLVKDESGQADYTNISEISSAQDTMGMIPTDADSTPDDDPENDNGGEANGPTDNQTDGNGIDDEDDHDPHTVEVFDLALTKKLTANQNANVFPGNLVSYEVNVYNQGNVAAYNIAITDYIPDGLLFNTGDNTSSVTGNINDWVIQNGNAEYTVDSLAALDSLTVFMNFRVDVNFTGDLILNYAEISFASNSQASSNNATDADSKADGDDTNDNGADPANDNNINGDGTIDEDDHDPEVIYIFKSDDIVIIGDTTTVQEPDTLIADDIDPEATPVFPQPIEEEYNCDLPTYCHHGLAIELMPVGMVQIWASDISVNDFDPCPTTQLGLWHPSLDIKMPTQLSDVRALPTQLVFTCEHIGNQDVQLYITDEEGNWNFCSTFVNVQDNNKGCQENISRDEDMAILGGQINTWKGDAVEEVLVNTIGNSYMTKTDGFYHFELPMKEDYTITPIKSDNPLNGVSTYDLVLMTKHILGVQPFDSPYQWIAADVNNSRTITTFDIVQLRKLILAIDEQFPNNTSWRFMEAGHTLERANPLLDQFPEVSSVSSLNGDTVKDFIAVKVGDINGSARPNSFHQSTVRTSPNEFKITLEDRLLKAGEEYEVAFTAKELARIQGYQFTLNFNDVSVENIKGQLLDTEHFGLHNKDKGWITVSWNHTPNGASFSEESLFLLRFKALKDGMLSKALTIGDQPTAVEAYDLDGNILAVKLDFTTFNMQDGFKLYQNKPNPFTKQTTIGYQLPEASPIELTLRDETGRIIQVIKDNGKAGYNQIQISNLDGSSGFIYYQLNSKFGTANKKMIHLRY